MRIRSQFLVIVTAVLFLFTLSSCVSKNSYEKVQAELAQVQQEKAGLQEKAASLSSDITREQDRVSGITRDIGNAKKEASDLNTAISAEQSKARDLSSQAENMKTKFSRQEGIATDLSNRIPVLEAGISREKNSASGLKNDISKAEAARLSLEKELGSLLGVTFVTYSNKFFNWAVTYPDDWKLDDKLDYKDLSAVWLKKDAGMVVINSRKVLINKSLDSFVDEELTFETNFYKNNYNESISVIYRNNITLTNNIIATDIVRDIGPGRKSRKVIALVDDRAIEIEAMTPMPYSSLWPTYEPAFNRIISSLDISK